MTVRAKLADGTVLNFPDGTDPAVVQRVVKERVSGQAQPTDTRNFFTRRLDDAEARRKSLPGPRAPDMPDVPGAIGHAFMEGARGLGSAVADNLDAAEQGRPGSLAMAPKVLGGLGAMALSPLTGTQDALVTKPVAQATGLPESDVGTAFMGASAAPGLSMAPRLSAPKQPFPTTAADVSQSAARRASAYVNKVRGKVTPEVLTQSTAPTVAEALGKPGEVAVSALARRTGATGDALAGHVSERQLGRADRLQANFEAATGLNPAAAQGDIEAMVAQGRKEAAPLYDAAYAKGAIDTEKLRSLVNRPSMRSAMGRAMKIAAEEGRDPTELGFRVEKTLDRGQMAPQTTVSQERVAGGGMRDVSKTEMVRGQDAPGQQMVRVENPTTQTWDYVKRGLDDVLEGYRDPTTRKLNLDEHGRAILQTLHDFRGELTSANPEYGAALAKSGDYLSAHQAFGDGGKLLNNGRVTEAQFSDRFAKATPSQQEALKGGIANHVFELARNGKLDPNYLKTPRIKAKLRVAFGQAGADSLVAAADHERRMLSFERRATPGAGSPTAELNAAMGEQDAGGGFLGDVMDRATQGQGIRGSLTGAIADRAKGAAATLRTPGMPIAARDEAGRLLMMSPAEYARYLKTVPPRQRPRLPDPKTLARGYVAGQPLLRRRDQ